MEKKKGLIKLTNYYKYPIYQLWMYDDSLNLPLEDKLKITILTIYDWLKGKLNIEIPPQIDFPSVDNYKDVSIDEFKNFHIGDGNEIEVVFIKEKGIFSLRLIQIDLKSEDEKLPHLDGRKITTEIGVCIYNKRLELGVRVDFSDPIDEINDVKVLRPAFIKNLIHNKAFSFKQTAPINEKYTVIKNKTGIEALKNSLSFSFCSINAVVLVDYPDKDDKRLIGFKDKTQALKNCENILNDISKINNCTVLESINSVTGRNQVYIEDEMEGFIKSAVGYANFYILAPSLLNEFKNLFNVSLSYGDGAILKSSNMGGNKQVIKNNKLLKNTDFYSSEFGNIISEFYVNMLSYSYENVCFLKDAKKKCFDNIDFKDIKSIEKYENIIEDINKTNKEKIDNLDIRLKTAIKNNDYQKEEISKKNKKIAILEEQVKQMSDKKKTNDELGLKIIEYLKEKSNRPKHLCEIEDWISSKFTNKILLNKRAVDSIKGKEINSYRLNLLCDCLEFLANEYRDLINGKIDEQSYQYISSLKYGRVFKVSPCGPAKDFGNIAENYKIKYGLNFKGKIHESKLDMHLTYGNDSEHLIRIYFLIDKEKDNLIVIGYMPEHLGTISNKT